MGHSGYIGRRSFITLEFDAFNNVPSCSLILIVKSVGTAFSKTTRSYMDSIGRRLLITHEFDAYKRVVQKLQLFRNLNSVIGRTKNQ